mgnify:CR=1 FL=1
MTTGMALTVSPAGPGRVAVGGPIAAGGVAAAPGAGVHPIVDSPATMGAAALELIVLVPALGPPAPGAVGHGVLHAAPAAPIAAGIHPEALGGLERGLAGVALLVDVGRAPGAIGEAVGDHPAAGAVGVAEVVEQFVEPAVEPREIARAQPREDEPPRGTLGSPLELERGVAQGCSAEGTRVCRVLDLEQEESRDTPVKLLRHRADLARVNDVDQPGALEHLQVMADRSLRQAELTGELLRRPGSLSQ